MVGIRLLAGWPVIREAILRYVVHVVLGAGLG